MHMYIIFSPVGVFTVIFFCRLNIEPSWRREEAFPLYAVSRNDCGNAELREGEIVKSPREIMGKINIFLFLGAVRHDMMFELNFREKGKNNILLSHYWDRCFSKYLTSVSI